ncbi:MAG: LysR substrate-binding domain-containing protein [Sphingomonadales bacterium]|jgi:LysR family glycine cleavage system transcriptional activator
MQRLPLSALQAFEATARTLNMTRAGQELNVTHGAISRQIKTLEADYGTALFHRHGRQLSLTNAGQMLFTQIHAGFELLRQGVAELSNQEESNTVTLTTLPSFAARWLIPRLARLKQDCSGADITIKASTQLEDLSAPEYDFAIRYGAGRWRGMTAHKLSDVRSFPVCSPGFLKRYGPIETLEQMARLPLIHNSEHQPWREWFQNAGLEVSTLKGGILVDEHGLTLQLAMDGHGVALARDILVERDLKDGHLVAAWPADYDPRFAYYVVYDAKRPLSIEAQRVIDWLLSASAGGNHLIGNATG